jgi:hypothetical protein
LSLLDPTQAPSGKHTTYAWHVMPRNPQIGDRDYETFKKEFSDRILETWARYCPNMTRRNVLGQYVYTAHEYTREFPNMRNGDIFMGAFSADQVMYNHFGYRTPIKNLYMAGSAGHPGGAISRGSGYTTAGIIARDLVSAVVETVNAAEALSSTCGRVIAPVVSDPAWGSQTAGVKKCSTRPVSGENGLSRGPNQSSATGRRYQPDLAAAVGLAQGVPTIVPGEARRRSGRSEPATCQPQRLHCLTISGSETQRARAVYVDFPGLMDAMSGEEITHIPLDEPFRVRFGNPYAVIHRGDLHGIFLKACRENRRIELHVSSEVLSYNQDGAGVTVRLASGENVRGSALIGADGLWSNVRKQVVGDGPPRISGHTTYRSVIPDGTHARGPALERSHPMGGAEGVTSCTFLQGWEGLQSRCRISQRRARAGCRRAGARGGGAQGLRARERAREADHPARLGLEAVGALRSGSCRELG